MNFRLNYSRHFGQLHEFASLVPEPKKIKETSKTSWEIPQLHLLFLSCWVVCRLQSSVDDVRQQTIRQTNAVLPPAARTAWKRVSFHGKKYASLEQTTLTWRQSCARRCSFSHLWVEIEGIMTQKTPTQQIFQATNQNHTSTCITWTFLNIGILHLDLLYGIFFQKFLQWRKIRDVTYQYSRRIWYFRTKTSDK